MSEIILKALVDAKIERAIAEGKPCPFPVGSCAAVVYERKAAQLTHGAKVGTFRVDAAQVAA